MLRFTMKWTISQATADDTHMRTTRSPPVGTRRWRRHLKRDYLMTCRSKKHPNEHRGLFQPKVAEQKKISGCYTKLPSTKRCPCWWRAHCGFHMRTTDDAAVRSALGCLDGPAPFSGWRHYSLRPHVGSHSPVRLHWLRCGGRPFAREICSCYVELCTFDALRRQSGTKEYWNHELVLVTVEQLIFNSPSSKKLCVLYRVVTFRQRMLFLHAICKRGYCELRFFFLRIRITKLFQAAA